MNINDIGENSDMEELKIHSSSLHNLAFDKNSNMPDDLRSQITI